MAPSGGDPPAAPSPPGTGACGAEEPRLDDARWCALWARLLARFEDEAGDPPGEALEPWEAELLGRLFSEELPGGGGASARRRGAAPRSRARGALGVDCRSLPACERRLRQAAARAFAEQEAAEALAAATALERAGDLAAARDACRRALALGPPRPLEAGLRLAQLLRVAGPAAPGQGASGACEAQLRRLLGEAAPAAALRRPGARRDALARLVLLLCQEGREEEALPLLRQGGWRLRLAPWVLRYAAMPTTAAQPDSSGQVDESSGPLRVFDDALPQSLLSRLQQMLRPGSAFWQEHGYNELHGSGEGGYFSYLHGLDGNPETAIDLVIRHVLSVAREHFPSLSEATAAEWWAHCRPHVCGHQMHFDSDNEGIGGPRHPICSCVTYVDAPPGVGGPTLVTDQRSGGELLATNGWLVYPRQGRLAVYDGSMLHGVLPGRGEPPEGTPAGARRITWMVAFWREISPRPFGADGLAGSARPLPSPARAFSAGPRSYTWQRALALPPGAAPGGGLGAGPGEAAAAPRRMAVEARKGVWCAVEGADEGAAGGGAGLPGYTECFQF